MTMLTLNSPNSSPSQSLSIQNTTNNNLRDAPFSSYLSSTEESFVLKLAGSTQTLRDDHVIWAKKMAKDREIGVFGAEKYFNEEMHEDSTKKMMEKRNEIKKADNVFLDHVKPIVRPVGTPSVRSESSWNSQSVLLKRNLAKRKTNKVHGKSFFSNIGCKCVCSDKDSVDIDEHPGESKLDKSVSCGSSIHTNHRMAQTPIKISFDMAEITRPLSQTWVKNETTITHNKQDSFGSNRLGLTVAKIRRDEIDEIPSSIAVNNNGEEETDSDASSDLFEIESLTGKASTNLSRQVSEGMMSGCVTPTNGYAPSEASIEWSVVTASVADFPLTGDAEEFRSAHLKKNHHKNGIGSAGVNGNNNELTRRRSGSFMGCKSHKAVRVAGDEYRTSLPHKPTQGIIRSHGSHMLYI